MTLPDGARLTWSCADGSRGRRWRGLATVDGVITHTSLIEVDLAGRPTRLELTTPAGLLTLHPSADGPELHGNVVRSGGDGVRAADPALGPRTVRSMSGNGPSLSRSASIAGRSRPGSVHTIEIDVVVIGPGLEITTTKRRIERVGEGGWRVLAAFGASEREIAIDPDGLPAAGSTLASRIRLIRGR